MAVGGRLDNSHLNGYLNAMSTYSVAQAKDNLSKLLDQALAGEEVTITRRGKPIARLVAELSAQVPVDRPNSPFDIDWLRRHVVTPKTQVDSGELLRRMRDDYRY
ncbi:MAG TPA: type II toxin-antitoxin system prevent-host-death family antitoxin [Caulobacteraceae bacterium]|nr:type II toxin-antitoxin system prevent-host-death family antitoxin [Caulobacteraceae bacterium]